MFKFLFKHHGKAAALEQKLALQREMERRRKSEKRRERSLKAGIANKLKSYNAQDDTTISNFTLPEDEVGKKLLNRPAAGNARDVWGQADPRETGRWNKENRSRRTRYK